MMLALALMVATIAFTQRPDRPERPKPNPELKKEMQEYIQKNVAPVLQKAQAEFDSNLSAEDLKFIQAKRIEASQIRAERKAEHQNRMEERKANRPKTEEERKARKEKFENMTDAEKEAFRKERMEKRKAMREEMKAEHGDSKKEVKAFMKRNEDLIKSTMTNLKPNYEKWIADQKAILAKYQSEDTPAMRGKKGKGRIGLFGLEPHHGKRHRKGMKGKRGERDAQSRGAEKSGKKRHKKGSKVSVAFVLWDGSIPTPPAESRESIANSPSSFSNGKVLLGQNYPNPARDITQIEIEVPEGINQMSLIVTDLNGKVTQRLNLTNLNTGKEIINLDVNDLPNGQYFYTIEYTGGKESKKMTISH